MLVAIISEDKNNKSLKLPLVDIKASSRILMRLEMAEMAQNKQKCLIFILFPRVRVENEISRIS